jgi:alpha/beta hydrolase family protein
MAVPQPQCLVFHAKFSGRFGVRPLEGATSYADVNGQRLYYEDSGGDGPAVVLSHGFLMDHEMFAPQVTALAPEFRVITWDQRGFGDTEFDGKRCRATRQHRGGRHRRRWPRLEHDPSRAGQSAPARLPAGAVRIKPLVRGLRRTGPDPSEGRFQIYGSCVQHLPVRTLRGDGRSRSSKPPRC